MSGISAGLVFVGVWTVPSFAGGSSLVVSRQRKHDFEYVTWNLSRLKALAKELHQRVIEAADMHAKALGILKGSE